MKLTVEQAIEKLQSGEFIILLDHHQRENEGDLVVAAQGLTVEKLNEYLSFHLGPMVVPCAPDVLDRLEIPLMVQESNDPLLTPFTVSIDHVSSTTGVSVPQRVKTITELCNPDAKPQDFRRPGHVFPLRAHVGGLNERQGHTEAAVTLMKPANLAPIALVAEIMNKEGNMASREELEAMNIGILEIDDLIAYEKNNN